MKLEKKHYPIACIICFILVLFFSAMNSYKIKENFIETIKTFTNNNNRKVKYFKKDISQIGGSLTYAIRKLFRR
jgi:hypothetical protein|tara:strand:- start:5573 stop:5794 length:222 start_codon:yes stop_codon:yes gene_type:complete